MAWVYIVRCADDSFYVGSTRNLEYRMMQHSEGRCGSYVERRRPIELVWAQEYERVDEACEVELKIKGWRRDKKLALIEGRYADLPSLSRSGSHRRPLP